MNGKDLQHGKAYDCTMDGDKGVEKTCIVHLATDSKTNRRYIIIEARKLQKEAPDFYRRLLAMSFQEIVDEDIDGGDDREWSSYVWRFAINEQGDLYYEDYDLYLGDFVETEKEN